MVSPYEVLGVSQTASEDEIEQAYRQRLKETHPDHDGSRTEFQLVQAAYEELQPANGPHDDGVDSAGRADQTQQRQTSANEQAENLTECDICGRVITDSSDAIVSETDGDTYCSDCVVETYCRSCDKDIIVTTLEFYDPDTIPYCQSCRNSKGQRATEQELHCFNCGSHINDISTAVYRESTDTLYCDDCAVETHCHSCGKELLLTIDQLSQIGGNPICSSCTPNRQTRTQPSNSQSNFRTKSGGISGIPTWGIVLIAALLIVAAYFHWYFRPEVIITIPSIDPDTVQTVGRAVPGLAILHILVKVFGK